MLSKQDYILYNPMMGLTIELYAHCLWSSVNCIFCVLNWEVHGLAVVNGSTILYADEKSS